MNERVRGKFPGELSKQRAPSRVHFLARQWELRYGCSETFKGRSYGGNSPAN